LRGSVFSLAGASSSSSALTSKTASRLSQGGEELLIMVNAPNVAPEILLPDWLRAPGARLSALEDLPLAIAGVAVNDVDVAVAPNLELAVTLSVAHGTLTLGARDGLTFALGDGARDATMRFAGAPAAVSAALGRLTYQGLLNWHGEDTLAIGVSDQGYMGGGLDGGTGALTAAAALALDVAPVADAPQVCECLFLCNQAGFKAQTTC
jgi:hypothetical protein